MAAATLDVQPWSVVRNKPLCFGKQDELKHKAKDKNLCDATSQSSYFNTHSAIVFCHEGIFLSK